MAVTRYVDAKRILQWGETNMGNAPKVRNVRAIYRLAWKWSDPIPPLFLVQDDPIHSLSAVCKVAIMHIVLKNVCPCFLFDAGDPELCRGTVP